MRKDVRPVLLAAALLCSVTAAAAPAVKPPPSKPYSNIGVAGQGFTMTLPDPKDPGHGLLLQLRAKRLSGDFTAGTLYGVFATLYQKGKPAATMQAPRAHGVNPADPVVVVTGGVRVKSLTQPGTYMTADQATWRPKQDSIVATGHVFYRDGKTGAQFTGPRLRFNTRLQTFAGG